jgi:hypothetical protein
MQVARILAATSLILGGFAACNDHNPKVVFPTDATIDGKTEVGAPQDAGSIHDGAAAAEVVVAADVGTQGADRPLAVDVLPDVNQGVDTSAADANVDRSADSKDAIDSPSTADGADLAVDGTGGSAVDVGVDSSASHDGIGAGG